MNDLEVLKGVCCLAGADSAVTIEELTVLRGLAEGVGLGSVTDAVLRTSAVPVLAINPDSERMLLRPNWTPSTVIVPLDGSDLAGESVPIALEIAEACGANVVFIQAVHLPSFAVSGPGAEYYGLDYGVSAQREGAHDYLRQFVELADVHRDDLRVVAAHALGAIHGPEPAQRTIGQQSIDARDQIILAQPQPFRHLGIRPIADGKPTLQPVDDAPVDFVHAVSHAAAGG